MCAELLCYLFSFMVVMVAKGSINSQYEAKAVL